MLGYEVYYRRNSWMIGSEYYWERAKSDVAGNPVFHGGDISTTWLITGETRGYITPGNVFTDIIPKKPVDKGGLGAFEAVLRFSYIDLNSGTLTGGTFWRITPMVNWYLNEWVRLEAVYGYGVLNRFDLRGGTNFFQMRLQTQY
jgi:phosphate-selective porin OprO/OprP